MEDRHIEKSHNKTCLLYHIVCPVKYRREVLTDGVVKTLTETCLGIQSRYDIHFIEIGTDGDHVHLLVQSVPTASPKQIPNKSFKQSRASRHGQYSNRIQRSSGCCGVESFGRKVTILTPSVSTQRQTSYETMLKIRESSTQNYTKASRPCLEAWNRHFIPRQLAAR